MTKPDKALQLTAGSCVRLAPLDYNGGGGGVPNYITPKSILHILRQRRALGVVFKEALH